MKSFLVAKYGTMCSKGNINYSMQNSLAEVKHAVPASHHHEGKHTDILKNISLIKNVPYKGLLRGAGRLSRGPLPPHPGPPAAGRAPPPLLAQGLVQVVLDGVQEVRGVQEVLVQLHAAERTPFT